MRTGNNSALGMIFCAFILVCGKQFVSDTRKICFFLRNHLSSKKTGGQIEGMGCKNNSSFNRMVQYLL